MTNPTRAQILNAHEALEALCARLPATRAAKESILKALPPRPRPTMAEIEWDDDKHYLAEAEHKHQGTVVMLSSDKYGLIQVFKPGMAYDKTGESDPELLTPTGKRYTLTEVQDG